MRKEPSQRANNWNYKTERCDNKLAVTLFEIEIRGNKFAVKTL